MPWGCWSVGFAVLAVLLCSFVFPLTSVPQRCECVRVYLSLCVHRFPATADDPERPGGKADFRQFLKDRAVFKEVSISIPFYFSG